MIELRIKLDPAGRADAILAALEAKVANISGGLKTVGEALLREQNRRFHSQTAPDGKPWAKLGPLTVALRGASGPILRRSGALMRSGAYNVSGTTLRVGVNTIYAAVHQFGATIVPVKAKMLTLPGQKGKMVFAKKATIPARPMVGFGDRDESAARRVIEAWLKVE